MRIGQKTPIFAKNPLPEYEQFSFSLMYTAAGLERSLDIVCKDQPEFDRWTQGLQYLVEAKGQVDMHNIERRLENRETVESEKLSVSFKGTQTIVNKREGICYSSRDLLCFRRLLFSFVLASLASTSHHHFTRYISAPHTRPQCSLYLVPVTCEHNCLSLFLCLDCDN